RGIARLPQARYVADHGDRSDAVVATLETPGRDRRVVYGAIEGEIELHVPLQTIDDRAAPADTQVRSELVRDRVRERVPVARRRLRARTVGPKFGDRPVEVALPHDLGRVRSTRDRIERMTPAAVRPDRIC